MHSPDHGKNWTHQIIGISAASVERKDESVLRGF